MIKKFILISLLSGFISALGLTALQLFNTIPLILEAEKYENNNLINYDTSKQIINKNHIEDDEKYQWFPENGFERTIYTFISNFVLSVGFSLILLSVYLYINSITIIKGIFTGFIGYLVFFLLPNMGLPAELPGTVASSLDNRQIWWIGTVVISFVGFTIIFFNKNKVLRIVAIFLILLPHIITAPHALIHAGRAPYEMLKHFEINSTITNGIFWIILSFVTIILFKKYNIKENKDYEI